jgi:FeS assembly SUF system protein
MDDKPFRQSLTVLPHSGKVEQLRKEVSPPVAPAKSLANQTLIERAVDSSKTPEQKAIEEKVIEVIKTIYDPEIPVNIYELGLIYSIDVLPENDVKVTMTLTAPACPVAGELVAQVEKRIDSIPEVRKARVELVWDPPWNKEMMSEVAKLELGFM